MPQPFTGQKKTPNKNFDTSKDNVCPTLRSMDMKNMGMITALQGQIGSDCKLVHGDRWQQIDGCQTERINQILTTDIMIDEIWTVHNDLFYTVGGTTDDNRYGVHHQTNWNVRFDHFVHTRTETHDQREVIHQPTENVNWFKKLVEFNYEKHSSQILYIVANGFKFEADGSEMSAKGLVVQRIGLRNQNEPAKIEWKSGHFVVTQAKAKIEGAETVVAAERVEVAPTVNAAPTAEDGVHVV